MPLSTMPPPRTTPSAPAPPPQWEGHGDGGTASAAGVGTDGKPMSSMYHKRDAGDGAPRVAKLGSGELEVGEAVDEHDRDERDSVVSHAGSHRGVARASYPVTSANGQDEETHAWGKHTRKKKHKGR